VDYLFRRPRARPSGRAGKPTFHAFWARDARARSRSAAEKAAFERLMDLSWTGSARTRAPHLPLRALRAHRAGPAHGPPRNPRGRRGPAPARATCSSISTASSPGCARVRRELLDQAPRALVPLHARDRPARRRPRHRRLRGLAAGGGRGRATTTRPCARSSATTATTSCRPCCSATGWRAGGWSWPRAWARLCRVPCPSPAKPRRISPKPWPAFRPSPIA
jgi:hypothetical protein